jgi:ABC-2 type transport system ATP-binding protein
MRRSRPVGEREPVTDQSPPARPISVSVQGLTKRYGDTAVVDDVSFDLMPGSVTAFLGPNGAGKTTTVRMMLGLVRPDGGRTLIDGRPYQRLRQPKRTVGAVLEATGFHPGRTARTHLTIVARAAGLDTSRVGQVLDVVGLADAADRRVRGFSLGMRQRLSLATALLGGPALLVLDEPANGLDPAGMAWLRTLLRDLARQGHTVLISSHVLAEIAQLADRVLVIAGGRLRFDGPLADLAGDSTVEAAFLRLTDAPARGTR